MQACKVTLTCCVEDSLIRTWPTRIRQSTHRARCSWREGSVVSYNDFVDDHRLWLALEALPYLVVY